MTAAFGAVNRGSNPCGAAKFIQSIRGNMFKFLGITVVAIIIIMLVGGVSDGAGISVGTDIFGNAAKERSKNAAMLTAAKIEAQAQVDVAQIKSDTSITTTSIWARTLPMLLIITIAGILLTIVFHWNGKSRFYHNYGQSKPPALEYGEMHKIESTSAELVPVRRDGNIIWLPKQYVDEVTRRVQRY